MSPEDEEAAAWAAWNATADPFGRAAAFGLPVFDAARAVALQLVRLGYQRAADVGQREKITGHRTAIEDAYEASPPTWDERGQVAEKLTKAAAELAKAKGTSPGPDLVKVAAGLADAKRQALLIGPPRSIAVPADLKAAWVKLVAALNSLLADLNPPDAPDRRDSRKKAADSISSYLQYFGAAAAEEVADRLLNLVVAERALEPAEPDVDQPVEFIQVSANTRTLLAARNELDTVHKLRGVELHHFAAFYKSSWRAYDWMWGRMDGSGWLVHILLDPRRILAIIEDHYQWDHGQRAENFASLLRETIGLPANQPGDCLKEDLGFLDKPDAVIPVSLPNSALFLARAWQNLIAASELPVIAEQMIADSGRLPPLVDPRNTADGQPKPVSARVRASWHKMASRHRQNQPLNGPPDPWATSVLTMRSQNKGPADFAEQLPHCPVRGETIAGQLHTPAFARIAAKAAAVATAAITAAPETPGALRPVLTTARTVTRTGYMATKVTGGSGWKTLLAGASPGRRRRRDGHPGTDSHRADGHDHRPGRPVPHRAGRVGNSPRPARRPDRHHHAGRCRIAHPGLGPHTDMGHRPQQQQRAGTARRPALAAVQLVGRTGDHWRSRPARRAAQRAHPSPAPRQPQHPKFDHHDRGDRSTASAGAGASGTVLARVCLATRPSVPDLGAPNPSARGRRLRDQ